MFKQRCILDTELKEESKTLGVGLVVAAQCAADRRCEFVSATPAILLRMPDRSSKTGSSSSEARKSPKSAWKVLARSCCMVRVLRGASGAFREGPTAGCLKASSILRNSSPRGLEFFAPGCEVPRVKLVKIRISRVKNSDSKSAVG